MGFAARRGGELVVETWWVRGGWVHGGFAMGCGGSEFAVEMTTLGWIWTTPLSLEIARGLGHLQNGIEKEGGEMGLGENEVEG